jgi:phosphoribosylaminoimidazolecarboxamide formyltransferase / IMP cyclohydrolase
MVQLLEKIECRFELHTVLFEKSIKEKSMRIQRALISVSDKSNLIPLAQKLQQWGIEIISTGGTAKFLEESKLKVTPLSAVTSFPEILDGRVKTLHPAIFAGILSVRDNEKHRGQMQEHNLRGIDLVVVNLYPFEQQAVPKDLSITESIEWIDIGGPSLLRAAAKNHAYVTVLADPEDYDAVMEEMEKNEGAVSAETRTRLALKVFQFTSYYDATIANYYGRKLSEMKFPKYFPINLKLSSSLRYGENPHQKGALYISPTTTGACLANAEKLQGKELSYNNLLDFDAAFQLGCALNKPSAVIIKHNNPCGVAVHEKINEAYQMARAADPVAAFGGVVAVNGVVDETTARIVVEAFIEGIVAKDFTPDALKILSGKTGMRLLKLPGEWKILDGIDLKKITGGMLIQDRDDAALDRKQTKVVTKREPTEAEWNGMEFGWIVAQYVKSNAIVFTRENVTVGIGAGQMSRVDSVKIARLKAQRPLTGTVVASDAFFPFRDGVDEIAAAGATAIIQPGGSIRDKEIIEAAEEHGIAMIFTGTRHFRH